MQINVMETSSISIRYFQNHHYFTSFKA